MKKTAKVGHKVHIALFCLDSSQKRPDGQSRAPLANQIFSINAVQTLALAKALRDDGAFDPLLVIDAESPLKMPAKENALSFLTTGPLLPFRLWHWQRRKPRLVVQTIGQSSMNAGYRFFRLRKKGSAIMGHAFFVDWPDMAALRSRAMRRAAYALCGSLPIAEHIGKNCVEGPDPIIDEPGLELEKWRAARPWNSLEGRHFVFGMGGSLIANSGALVVIRAMAALWQRADLPPWEVRMFGSGPRFDEILAEAEKLGVAGRLCLLSDQPLWRVAALCHVWLLPGENPREFPAVTWAGCCAGLPVIGVKSPLHRERLAPAPNAPAPFLGVAPNDPQKLARAMIGLMKNEGLRQRLARGGEAIRSLAGVEAMTARTLALYRSFGEDWKFAGDASRNR